MLGDIKILPCPCCDDTHAKVKITEDNWYIVECENTNCGCQTAGWYNKEAAIAAWNKRPAETTPICRVSDLVYSIKDYGSYTHGDVTTLVVESITTFGSGKWFFHVKNSGLLLADIISSEDFGKTVFLTCEEAEIAAIKAIKARRRRNC